MTKYNGWSNYETWNFKLWLDNDEGVHNYIMDKIKKISSQKFDNKISQIADFLKSNSFIVCFILLSFFGWF